jgi:hypothetical protein
MTPETWLRQQALVKLRSKLPDWTREDLLALAMQEFKGHDLDKKQLDQLQAYLRDPKPSKPIAHFYTVTAAVKAVVANEVTWVDNGVFAPLPASQWVLKGTRLAPGFDSAESVFGFARALAATSPRESWGRLIREFRTRTTLSRFNLPPGLPYLAQAESAQQALTRRQQSDAAMNLPLPDSADIRKRYYGLEPGQVLPHTDGDRQLVVQTVRVNLDSPPTITFREEAL